MTYLIYPLRIYANRNISYAYILDLGTVVRLRVVTLLVLNATYLIDIDQDLILHLFLLFHHVFLQLRKTELKFIIDYFRHRFDYRRSLVEMSLCFLHI